MADDQDRLASTDAELVATLAKGEVRSLEDLWRRHADAVKRFCIRRCATPDDVADAVSATFLAARRAARRYEDQGEGARPWLLGIARNEVRRQHRSVARRLRLALRLGGTAPRFAGDEYDAVERAIDAARLTPVLRDALAALSAGEREVLELVAGDDLTPTEAAQVLGTSPNAARVRLSRARSRARGLLASAASAPAPALEEDRA